MIEFICRFGFAARFLEAGLAAFILASCTIPAVRGCALRFGIVSASNPDSARKSAIPLLGGFPIIIAALFGAAMLGALPFWMLLGAGGLMMVGVLDDAITLRPSSKLVFEAVVVAATMPFLPPLSLTAWPLVSIALASFFLLSTVNAYNLIDGLDGLAAGIGICSALGIAAIATANGDSLLAIQSLAVAGALAGFLLFNRYPATIFMGDCGALPLGFLLGAMALRASSHAHQALPVAYAIPLLIMLVPLLDMLTVALSRVSRDAPITRRGLDHSHHKLLALGFSEPAAVFICWSVAAMTAASAALVAHLDSCVALLVLPSMATVLAMLATCVIDLKVEVYAGAPISRPFLGDSARKRDLTDFWRGLAGICFDSILIVAAYFDAFLLRLGSSLGNDKLAALLANVPIVLLTTYISFLAAGLYRTPAPRLDWARLASAAAGAGITILLASYLLPLMISGIVVLAFVGILFGLLAFSRFSAEVLPDALRIARIQRVPVEPVASSYLRAAVAVPSMGKELASNETATSKKVMAR